MMLSPGASPADGAARAARFAVAVIFLVHGILVASWVVHIPTVQARLGLSEGLLGLALLGIAGGSLVAMPATGLLVARFGSRPLTVWTSLAFCAALPLPLLASRPLLLGAALAVFGACAGAMDVAMNAHAVAVEQRWGRPVMSGFHAMFSLGGFAGAALGGLLLSHGAAPLGHVAAVAAVLAVVGLAVFGRLLPAGVDVVARTPGRRLQRPSGWLLGLGALGFCVLLSEGAMGDWSAVYLRTARGAGPGLAAAGFATFSLTMGGARLVGDRLASRLGSVALLRWGTALAAVGLALALVPAHPYAAVAGFGLVGLGLANAVPVLYSAAGRAPGTSPGAAIATVTTIGYFGLLAGPPLIGFAAEVLTLTGALWIVVACCLLVAVVAPLAGRRGRGASVKG